MSGSTVRLFSLFLFGLMVAGTTRAQVVPDYMNVIVGHPATTKGEIAAARRAGTQRDADEFKSKQGVQKNSNKIVDWSV